ncbi:sensor domain-containing diguanylate cyclase [Legionella parisiensis]|uniref:diguanylate cyclase n=1 Tax=Legionella parisiensis TaxID=45071 RepID=A0A1E5JLX4_9GAMM|nr:diguanylate cyclase [Legionella parisiensis]KTD41347.1 sensor histidine kinase [Legionella parisiensis]OEH45512.1 putative diguanylate cyclase YcdT [Legionella parisiensis]STX76350.1 sensor histidine kinase [Legionella parisiensis]
MDEKAYYKAFTNLIGIICFLTGLLDLSVRYFNIHLSAELPIDIFMRPTTALSFILAGLSLICLNRKFVQFSRVLSSILLLFSGVILSQYILNVNVGIDELFIRIFSLDVHHYPGPMASSVALSFIVIALCFLIVSFQFSNYWLWMCLFGVFFTLSLGFIATTNHFIEFTTHFGAGPWMKISIYTSLGLILLSLAIISYINSKNVKHSLVSLPLIAVFVILNITVFGWQFTKKNQENSLNMLLQLKVENVEDVIESRTAELASSFSRITYRWLNRDATPASEWQADMMHHIHDQPGYNAILWIDNKYQIRWVAPEESSELIKEYNFYDNPDRRREMLGSLAKNELQISSQFYWVEGNKVILLLSPMLKENYFQGFMVGIINTEVFLEDILKKIDIQGYNLGIYDASGLLYTNAPSDHKYYKSWKHSITLPLYGQNWKIIIWPSIVLHNQVITSFFPTMILIIGIMIALLSGFLIHTLQFIKENSDKLKRTQTELANARERLQGIIEGSSDLVAAIDLNYDFIAFNTMYKCEVYRIFKIDLEVGMSFRVLLQKMSVENQTKAMAYWERAMKGTGFTVIESFKDKRHDGLDFEIHYNPIHDSEGKLIGVSHFAINVHQRIQSERKLEESKVELENVVKSLETQNKELELLKELMSLLQSSLSMDDAIEIIKNYSKRILSGTSGIVYLISSDNLNLISRVLIWGEPVSNLFLFTPKDCLSLLRHQSYYISDTTEGVLCNHIKKGEKKPIGYVCLPLFAQNEMLGLFYVEFGLNTDNQRLIALAQIISEQSALSIYNIKLRDVLKTQSTQDSLTGVYNRRFFEEYLQKEILKAKNHPFTFALLLIDIDYFKKVNDTYGHLVGDQVLFEFAAKIRQICRQEDLISRWGGEEFMVFLRIANLDAAKLKAEVIRESIEKFSVEVNQEKPISITISIGVSFYPYDGKKVDELISKADEALYEAKKMGRNKVVASSSMHQNKKQ